MVRMRWLLVSIGLLTGCVADVSPGSSLGRLFYGAENIDENDFVRVDGDPDERAAYEIKKDGYAALDGLNDLFREQKENDDEVPQPAQSENESNSAV